MKKKRPPKPQDDDTADVWLLRKKSGVYYRIEETTGVSLNAYAMTRARRIDELRSDFFDGACPDGVEICGDCPLVADRWQETITSALADCPVVGSSVMPHSDPAFIVTEEATPSLPASMWRKPVQGDLFE